MTNFLWKMMGGFPIILIYITHVLKGQTIIQKFGVCNLFYGFEISLLYSYTKAVFILSNIQ